VPCCFESKRVLPFGRLDFFVNTSPQPFSRKGTVGRPVARATTPRSCSTRRQSLTAANKCSTPSQELIKTCQDAAELSAMRNSLATAAATAIAALLLLTAGCHALTEDEAGQAYYKALWQLYGPSLPDCNGDLLTVGAP